MARALALLEESESVKKPVFLALLAPSSFLEEKPEPFLGDADPHSPKCKRS